MEQGVRPARPHTGRTDEGKRIREVLTYTRRGSRLGTRQEAAWARHRDEWWIPDEAVDRPGFDLRSWFGREAPLVVEIGCGVGEATVALAATRPSYDVLGFEVWHPGCADTFCRMEQAGVANVRMVSVDAVWTTESPVGPRHASTSCGRSSPTRGRSSGTTVAGWCDRRTSPPSRPPGSPPGPCGGWRPTGPTYADQMVEVLEAEPLRSTGRGSAPRWDDRPLTRFERRRARPGGRSPT